MLLLAWLVARPGAKDFQVATPAGLRTVRVGMTPEEVTRTLGPRLGVSKDAGRICYRYGMPTLDAPSFVMHDACFEGGRLVHVTTRRFRADRLEPPPPGP